MIYRVHVVAYQADAYGEDGSLGFRYFGTKEEAEIHRASEARAREIPVSDITIESVKTPKRKAEILQLLNTWANHPDNG